MSDDKSVKKKTSLKDFDVIRKWSLYLMLFPAVLAIFIFSYIPMVGIVVAFERYDPFKGMFGSPWVGLENFKFFFSGSSWLTVTVNTLYLNIIFIVSGTIASIIVAVMMTEIRNKAFSKTAQTIMTLPNFISWATVALFSLIFLAEDGIVNKVIEMFGGDPVAFYSDPVVWPATFCVIRIWKGAGWGAIVYMAAIMGIDSSVYEAAKMDGASRFQCIFRITLPMISNTIILLFLMSVGGIFRGDFAMIYPFIGDNATLFPTTDVIDTYLFRALRTSNNMGSNMAINLYQNILGFLLVFGANYIARRFSRESAIF